MEAVVPPGPHRGGSGGGRDRYLDLLRALALVRVVTLPHLRLGLAARRLPLHGRHVRAGRVADGPLAEAARRPGRSGAGCRDCCRPLWPARRDRRHRDARARLGPDDRGPTAGWWSGLLLLDPPAQRSAVRLRRGGHRLDSSTRLAQERPPLWYLRTYLWFVLLSPLILHGLRRAALGVALALPRARRRPPVWPVLRPRPPDTADHRLRHLRRLLAARLRPPRGPSSSADRPYVLPSVGAASSRARGPRRLRHTATASGLDLGRDPARPGPVVVRLRPAAAAPQPRLDRVARAAARLRPAGAPCSTRGR